LKRKENKIRLFFQKSNFYIKKGLLNNHSLKLDYSTLENDISRKFISFIEEGNKRSNMVVRSFCKPSDKRGLYFEKEKTIKIYHCFCIIKEVCLIPR